jgi:hypothetical protein
MKRLLLALGIAGLVGRPAPLHALTDAEARAGRAVVKRYADTVISIELVITLNISMGDRTMPLREVRLEVNGTVIAPSGLTVTSLAAIDPRAAIDTSRAGPNGARLQIGDTQFKEVKLRLADGTEIPGRVVLKDADTDLAFVAPDAGGPGRVFAAVDLKNAAKGELLATYFDVTRASRDLQRVPVVTPSTVVGIVEKPRRLYLASGQAGGCPVFDDRGAVLGLCVRHIANGRAGGFVVLPAAQVAETAQQAAAEAAKPAPETAGGSDEGKPDAPPGPSAP